MTQGPDNLEEDALFLAKLRVKGDASNSCTVIRRCVMENYESFIGYVVLFELFAFAFILFHITKDATAVQFRSTPST